MNKKVVPFELGRLLKNRTSLVGLLFAEAFDLFAGATKLAVFETSLVPPR